MEKKVVALKKRMLEASYRSRQGFLASSFSIIDILVVLYYGVMDFEKDCFVLSKGHAVLALYAILEDLGILDKNELETFGAYQSRLPLMAERNSVPGVNFSTGSLGHGLPEAIGVAYAKKIRKEPGRVFVLVGDGEINEGTNWEAISIAYRLGLDNLVLIIDNNHSTNNMFHGNEVKQQIKNWGWNYQEVNGHDISQLKEVFNCVQRTPMAVIAKTVKGKGCRTMEFNPGLWHSKVPNKEEFEELLIELEVENGEVS